MYCTLFYFTELSNPFLRPHSLHCSERDAVEGLADPQKVRTQNYQKVSQQDRYRRFPDRRHVYRCLLFQIGFEVLLAPKVTILQRRSLEVRTFSVEMLMQTAPSFSKLVGSLKVSPGTPQITTSLCGTHS